MRLGVIADVHANLPVLRATFAALDHERIDELWCLGDLVGRGPDPEVVDLVRDACALVLAGNHDAVVTGIGTRLAFDGALGRAANHARAGLGVESLAWLSALHPTARRHGMLAVHASLRDPYWEHVSIAADARPFLARDSRIVLFGHTHDPVAYVRHRDGDIETHRGKPGVELSLAGTPAALINPGAVGCVQDRHGDPRASYLVLDTTKLTLRWERVAYDATGLERRIAELGLPPFRQREERST